MSGNNLIDRLNISTFGGLSIRVGDEPVVGFASRKAEALLVYLAVTGREHPREALADVLWDDRSQERAASNLRTVLASLRKCLGDYVSITRHSAAIDPDANLFVDTVELERVTRGIQDKGGVFWLYEARLLGQALDLYTGDFLSGFNIRGCRDFEDWMLLEREHLYQQTMVGLEGLVDYLIERGGYQAGIAAALRWTQLNPLMENAHCKLMRLLVYAGRTADALAQFETCSQILDSELGLEPSRQTKALYDQILNGQLSTPEPKPIREPAFLNQPPAFLDPQTPDPASFPVFVARRRQLERLRTCLASAASGEGQVVFVSGGPGRGKTALLDKFTREALASNPDLLVAEGRCNFYKGIGDYYLPFREALGMLAGDVEGKWNAGLITSQHARRMWNAAPLTAGAVLEHGPHLLDTFLIPEELLARAEMVALASLQGTVQRSSFNLTQLREQIVSRRSAPSGIEQTFLFEQYANVLNALSKTHPLLLLLDDFQWADNSSIALLFHLARRLPGTRALIAVAYRPDEVSLGRDGKRHPLEKILSEIKLQYGDVWVDLAGIPEQEGREFVDELLDSEPNRLDENFRQGLFQHTEGYALFTVELLHTLQERGFLLKDEQGHWKTSHELDWEQLPARVEAVIEERIGRLEAELHDILSVASVEGEDFTAQVVGGITRIDERDLMRNLAGELEKRHRLVVSQGSITLDQRILSRYRFAHSLFQRYLYNELDDTERLLLHRQIGQVLEELYAGQTDLIAEQLAFHFRGDDERERHYSKIAGERAAARYANTEALRYFSRALELTPQDNLEERYDLLLKSENIHYLLGERAAQQADLILLKELLKKLNDDRKVVEVLLRQTRLDSKIDNFQKRFENSKQVIRLAEASQDQYSQAEGHLHLGCVHWWGFRDRKSAVYELETSLRLARESGNRKVEAKVLRLIGGISNDFDNEPEYSRQALQIYRQLGDMAGESKVVGNMGSRHCYDLQQFKEAKGYYEKSLAICQKIGFRENEVWLDDDLANLYTYVGRYSSAWDYLRRGLKISRDIDFEGGQAMSVRSMGIYFVQLGAYSRALDCFERALDLSVKVGVKAIEIQSLCGLSLANLRRNKTKAALEYARKAMRLAEQADDMYLICGTHLGLAYEGLGDLEKAAAGFELGEKYALELSLPLFAAENQARLARLALASGDMNQAGHYIYKVLDYMDGKLDEISTYKDEEFNAVSPFDGVDEPFLIYLTLYRVLDALGDPRALEILASVNNLLGARLANIEDQDLRRSYLEDVPYQKDLITAWTENCPD